MQTTSVDESLLAQLVQDEAALEHRTFVFSDASGLVLIGTFGKRSSMFGGPGFSTHMMDIGIERLNGRSVMGIGVGFAFEGSDRRVISNLVYWEDRVHEIVPGTLDILPDFEGLALPEDREIAKKAHLHAYWLRARIAFGKLPWELVRCKVAPPDVIGTRVGFVPTYPSRREPTLGKIIALARTDVVRMDYWLLGQSGIIELHQDVSGAWWCHVDNRLEPVVVNYLSE